MGYVREEHILAVAIPTMQHLTRAHVRIYADKTPDARPAMPEGKSVRATLRAPAWTAEGYAPDVPGFVWWFFGTRKQPLLAHGESIFDALGVGETPLRESKAGSVLTVTTR